MKSFRDKGALAPRSGTVFLAWIRIRKVHGSGSGLEKFMDRDQVCPERLDPDPANIRPDLKPWSSVKIICRERERERDNLEFN